MNPNVSVIITCYNYARYLTDAVESVVHQTFQDFEIIIVNDGSTDETQKVAEFLIVKYPQNKIHIINQENSGQPAISRNRGIEKAKGEYILCLDADDKIAPTMLEECFDVLKSNQNISFVYTDRLDFDGSEQVVGAGEYDFELLKYDNHISYCALIKRVLWENIGGYRTNIKGCEDWDFWVAAAARGFVGKRVPKPLFHYRRHDTGVFQSVQWRLHEAHAQIVENNSEVYSSEEITSAKKILTEIQEWKSNSKPTVSVIIPTYNRVKQLSQAINSVLDQTFRDFEIIVINDGGVDVKNLIDDLNSDKNIVYINLATNRGLPAARNIGIKIARGKYIAYLDDDDIYYTGHLKTLVDFLETTQSKVAYTDAYRAVYNNIDGRTLLREKEKYESVDFDRDRIFVENYIPVLCVVHAKSCFDNVGIFDETLTSHEDWDLWIRMSMKFDISHIKKITCEFSAIDSDVRESERRTEFLFTLLKIYEKYKSAIIQKPNILEAQKNKFIQSLIWAYDHIKGLEYEKQFSQNEIKNLQERIQSLQYNLAQSLKWAYEHIKVLEYERQFNQNEIKNLQERIQSLQYNLKVFQDNLTWRILNHYIFKIWDKWIIPFGSKRRAVLERFFKKSIKSEITEPINLQKESIFDYTQNNKTKKRIIKKASRESAGNEFILYTNTHGNYFFNEIRDLIADGIRELGYQVKIKSENEWLEDESAWHIVISPHEFFYLGKFTDSDVEILPEKLIIVNAEQPSTKWFSLAENYFPVAKFIWDINYNSAIRISEQGFQCDFLPLGFVDDSYLFQEVKQLPENYTTCFLKKDIKNCSFLNEPYTSRPIDISFVGCLTPRRDEFFAKAAPAISNFQSYIHFSDGLAAPVIPGLTTHINTEIVLGLMQRSKIMLNIHHGSDNYFEWHRIVLLGIAQKTLVISEPSISSPIFEPGIHYVEAKLQDIPEKIKYYLSTPSGIKEAEAIIEKGYKKLTEECRLTEFLQPLISRLFITEPQ